MAIINIDLEIAQARGPAGPGGNATLTDIANAIAALKGAVSPGNDTLAEIEANLNLKAPLASPTFTGNVIVPTQAAGNSSTRAASTAFVQQELTDALTDYLPLSGGTLLGFLTLNANPTSALHAATKQWVEAGFLALGGGTLTGALTLSGDPTNALHAASKQYVDALVQGLDPKPSARAASPASTNISIASAPSALDGVTGVANDRWLLRQQTAPAENGLYKFNGTGAALTRVADMDAWAEVPGAYCWVEEGSTNADTAWICTANTGGTLGTTAITWTQFGGAGTYTAGTGLSLTGGVFAIADAELLAIAGLTSAADRLAYFTGSGTAALATFTSFGRSLVDDADATAARATLGLVIGTDVQAFDAELAAIAGLTSVANKGIQFTGSGTAATYDLTTAGKALLDDADAQAQRVTLGLTVVGALKTTALGVVSQAAASDLSNGVQGSGAVVLAASPTITTPTIAGATLSGTIAGGNQNINDVVIGASTPRAGTFTTLAANSSATVGSASGTPNVTINGASTDGSGPFLAFKRGAVSSDLLIGTAGAILGGAEPNVDWMFYNGTGTGKTRFRHGANAPLTLYGSGGIAVGADADPGAGAIGATGSIKSISASGGVGYATGAGSTVTQSTSKSTGVTINAVCGAITMNAAALAAAAEVGFTVTNSAVAATDVVAVNIKSGATADSYGVTVDAVAAGSFRIQITNRSAGSLGEALVLSFAVIKAVAA